MLEVGDQVLILSPQLTGKMENHWSGPYIIEEQVSPVTNRVQTPDCRKKACLFHVNSLKAWQAPVTVLSVRYCDHLDGDEETDPELELFNDNTGGDDVIGN